LELLFARTLVPAVVALDLLDFLDVDPAALTFFFFETFGFVDDPKALTSSSPNNKVAKEGSDSSGKTESAPTCSDSNVLFFSLLLMF